MTDPDNRQLDAIILAAGKGTRMNSDLPKVLHPVADRAMVHWVIDACEAVGCRRITVVVGHRSDLAREELADRASVTFVEQTEQLGTGHAVMMAADLYQGVENTDTLVLCGDGPLIRNETLTQLLERHRTTAAAATLATAVIDDPTGYGRVVRSPEGRLDRIVEQKDATEDELVIREVNPSYYCFDAAELFAALPELSNTNASGEYYITDLFGLFRSQGKPVEVIDAVPPQDVLSINNPPQLAEVDAILRARLGMEVTK